MTLQRAGGASGFSASADDYAATMAPALAPMAAEVVRRAALGAGEAVLDVGTGTGTGAALARGEGRTVRRCCLRGDGRSRARTAEQFASQVLARYGFKAPSPPCT